MTRDAGISYGTWEVSVSRVWTGEEALENCGGNYYIYSQNGWKPTAIEFRTKNLLDSWRTLNSLGDSDITGVLVDSSGCKREIHVNAYPRGYSSISDLVVPPLFKVTMVGRVDMPAAFGVRSASLFIQGEGPFALDLEHPVLDLESPAADLPTEQVLTVGDSFQWGQERLITVEGARFAGHNRSI